MKMTRLSMMIEQESVQVATRVMSTKARLQYLRLSANSNILREPEACALMQRPYFSQRKSRSIKPAA